MKPINSQLTTDNEPSVKKKGQSMGKLFGTAFVLGLTISYTIVGHAGCGVTMNGRPMSDRDCAIARQVYGYVEPGHYVGDRYGNWVKIGDPHTRGNIYEDAQRGRGGSGGGRHWSDGQGLTRTPFGSVGGGFYLDN